MTISTCDNSQFNNINKRNNSNYAIVIEEINNILFWVKRVPIPGMSIVDDQELAYEGDPFNIEGNTLSFNSPIEITFFLDEKLYVLQYLYNWIKGFQMGEDYVGKKELQTSLLLFDNNGDKVQGIFNFQNMYCQEITQLELNNAGQENQEVSASFKFDKWIPEFRNKLK